MQRTSRYVVAALATILATMAIACAEPTSPRQDSPCSGGGTETWDHCGTTSTTIADTLLVKKP